MDVDQAIAAERERICCWLHDTTLQMLELIAAGGLADEADSRRLMGLAASAAGDLRTFVDRHALPAPAAFEEGVRLVVDQARALATHAIELRLGPIVDGLAPTDLGELLGALREALTNVRRHAGATTVDVYAEATAARVLVVVRDDGLGTEAPTGWGLAHSILGRMDRLGGRALVECAPGRGTLVRLELDRAA
jgi:signal transduction histidine kinase